MAAGKKVAAYCRVSTLEQKKKGLGMDIQIRDVTAFAQAQNLVLDVIYPDKAESGAAENRKELKKLIRACLRGEVGTVIIPSLDRLSRDVRIAENLFWQFDQLDVRVLIADMPTYDHSNRRDVLIRQIREAIAEDNRKEIIERLWKGRQERTRKGRMPGGNLAYGFTRSNRTVVEHPIEAKVVRLIFQLYRSSISGEEIARQLNEQGFRRRNGTDWTKRQVLSILGRTELYEQGLTRYGSVVGTNDKLILIRKRDGDDDEK